MTCPHSHPLGASLPSQNPHAISVSLPTWKANVGYQEGERSVIDSMTTGYPRFMIHRKIAELSSVFLRKSESGDENCLIFPTQDYASECRAFLLSQSSHCSLLPRVWQAQFSICAKGDSIASSFDLHAVFYPSSIFRLGKQFWQHTGFGISSRMAQRSLELLAEPGAILTLSRTRDGHLDHVNLEDSTQLSSPSLNGDISSVQTNSIKMGRTNDVAALAKRTLRSRLAGFLRHNGSPSQYGTSEVCENDVYLYPTGMTAIFNAHRLVMSMYPKAKCVCLGFPYTDTLKVLQKWSSGCHFFGRDPDSDMEELEVLLASSPDTPPISALFCELTSNPRLQSPRLDRLRALADKYDFLIVLDDTIGTFANVDVLPYVDIVTTSLSKFVSGYANVLGGSLVLNPRMRHYAALKTAQATIYADTYYDEDVITMEYNSRDFVPRMRTINTNANILCEFLRSRSRLASPTDENFVIKEIFYPKWITRPEYDLCRLPQYPDGEPAQDNFGGLFSLTFTSDLASHTFFNALSCAKGPSLGTNFTLVCPYTILAHYAEREWAAEYGVEEGLVRVSVGLEDHVELVADFDFALRQAEDAVRSNCVQDIVT